MFWECIASTESPVFFGTFFQFEEYTLELCFREAELTQKLHDKIEMYRDADLSEDCSMTLGEWLDKWINEFMIFSVRPSTITSYQALITYTQKPARNVRKSWRL